MTSDLRKETVKLTLYHQYIVEIMAIIKTMGDSESFYTTSFNVKHPHFSLTFQICLEHACESFI